MVGDVMSIAKEFITTREKEFIDYVTKHWGEMTPAELQIGVLGFNFGLQCANDYNKMIQKAVKV